jgi:hypothetical protein
MDAKIKLDHQLLALEGEHAVSEHCSTRHARCRQNHFHVERDVTDPGPPA